MFREGHNVRKTSDAGQKRHCFFFVIFPSFFVKNRCKIDAKACRTIICTKIYKKKRLEPDFLAKSQFLTDFGNPSGSPERSKRDELHWQKLLPRAIWCNFVALQAFLSLLAPFRLPSGTILIQFWLHFAYFQAPFFIPLWHKRDCLPAVQHDSDLLSVSGPAECAKRFELIISKFLLYLNYRTLIIVP